MTFFACLLYISSFSPLQYVSLFKVLLFPFFFVFPPPPCGFRFMLYHYDMPPPPRLLPFLALFLFFHHYICLICLHGKLMKHGGGPQKARSFLSFYIFNASPTKKNWTKILSFSFEGLKNRLGNNRRIFYATHCPLQTSTTSCSS